MDALVNWTVQTYGAIDLLVANAGIVKGADFLDMSEQDFDDVIRVNLKGVFLVSNKSIYSTPTPSRNCTCLHSYLKSVPQLHMLTLYTQPIACWQCWQLQTVQC